MPQSVVNEGECLLKDLPVILVNWRQKPTELRAAGVSATRNMNVRFRSEGGFSEFYQSELGAPFFKPNDAHSGCKASSMFTFEAASVGLNSPA
jgi:hypothetical protein